MLDNVKRIQNPTLFADLTVKNPTVNLIGFDFLIDRLIAFEHKTLFEILLSNVKDPLSINETEEVILATSFADKSSMVFLTRSGKAIEYRDGLFSFADTPDGTFKRGVDMKSYNDKVYILDPERNQIWRYKSKRTGYDAGEAYNKDGDVSKAVAFAIDSSIYVLNGDGTMSLLYAGEKKDFSIIKTPLQKVEKPTKIFTSDNLNQLFVLEPGKSRVLVYTKDFKQGGAMPSGAVYTTQYVFENVGELVNMYVSRDENKLYVMTSQKIYVTPLN